ncbi:cytochrome-c peroxidase [Vaginella massiliensis]|uniref:cytochrome-c peroxidase n=1 Tax=Vaginella massiliensis TaxID=1816680 RepID=UPI000839ACB0|nr:cytochrome c peroxidase [Vaginella massiliensis]
MKKVVFVFILSVLFVGCITDDIDVGEPLIDEEYVLQYPEYFPTITNTSAQKPLTKLGVELGRKLFYDGRLSRNNTISCGSCHIQENAFTHHGHNVSHGIDGRLGIRNAPPIQNLAFVKHFNWDGVLHDLRLQPLIPITTFEEMDSAMEEVIEKLKNDAEYRKYFRIVFGDEKIDGYRILSALEQFMRSVISSDSKYDKYLQGKIKLSTEEHRGLVLFQNKCSTCHSGTLQTDQSFRNTGLYYDPQYQDAGRFRVTLDSVDWMKFRVPSLRNVELTAPYMHDGRFYSLEAVLNHYSHGIRASKNLDTIFLQGARPGIAMTNEEKTAIIAFLHTLTDTTFINNPAYAEF